MKAAFRVLDDKGVEVGNYSYSGTDCGSQSVTKPDEYVYSLSDFDIEPDRMLIWAEEEGDFEIRVRDYLGELSDYSANTYKIDGALATQLFENSKVSVQDGPERYDAYIDDTGYVALADGRAGNATYLVYQSVGSKLLMSIPMSGFNPAPYIYLDVLVNEDNKKINIQFIKED